MKIYIAGKLCTEQERAQLEKVAKICEKLGFEIFLPHRDGGLCEGVEDIERIFKEDIKKGFEGVDLIVAVLDGLHVGAGTAWELGYAYAKGIKAIGFKSDEKVEEALDSLSAILIGSMKFVENFNELKLELKKLI
ncbi:MAG: nucleoside 2-deoxyribosyltransferase [Nanoarchaeota archaeon]|nr:nucleoside 2-deoxyribosyltransferase [Nanoarchaeota archaeon]